MRLEVGSSFDVTAKKRQTNFRIVSDTPAIYESAYQIDLANAKTQPVDVLVVEQVPGDWRVLSESLRSEKTSSGSASWTVHVPADGRATLTYSTRVRL